MPPCAPRIAHRAPRTPQLRLPPLRLPYGRALIPLREFSADIEFDIDLSLGCEGNINGVIEKYFLVPDVCGATGAAPLPGCWFWFARAGRVLCMCAGANLPLMMQAEISRALANLDFTAIDFETANERRDSACAVGVVRVRAGQIVEEFQTLLRPRVLRVDWRNQQVHGIAEADLRHAPSLADAWPALLPYLHQQAVVAHNSAFDVSVLEYTCRDFSLPIPAFHALCSVKLAKLCWPHLERHRLNYVAEYFGLALNHHDALSDARACAEITVQAFRSGTALPLCYKQRELTAGLAARAAKQAARVAVGR